MIITIKIGIKILSRVVPPYGEIFLHTRKVPLKSIKRVLPSSLSFCRTPTLCIVSRHGWMCLVVWVCEWVVGVCVYNKDIQHRREVDNFGDHAPFYYYFY